MKNPSNCNYTVTLFPHSSQQLYTRDSEEVVHYEGTLQHSSIMAYYDSMVDGGAIWQY